jgi:hypothetical protein
MREKQKLITCIYLFIYGSTAFVELVSFFSFLIDTQSGGLFGRGIRPSQRRYLHTEQHKDSVGLSLFEEATTY